MIPLLGDAVPDRPKAPAVEWKPYQSRRATESDFIRWFRQSGFPALAIVTGKISNLVVLDFDDPELYHTFCLEYPDLAERHVIQTRRGFHIYFHLPSYLYLHTRKGQGIDLLANGCYVVARPTTIASFTYTLIRGGQPLTLTQQHINRINHFLDLHAAHTLPEPAPAPTQPPSFILSADDLQAFYRAQIGQGRGRNQSLFTVACTARDYGWSQPDVQNALVALHIHTPSSIHASETDAQRQREALHTIRSVFSKPARPPRPLPVTSPQLPTRIRESLYALQLTCVVRTLEGLREKGIQPGQGFTAKQAQTLLKGLVGRDSIIHALQATTSDGQTLFAREEKPPLEPPPASVDAAQAKHPSEVKKCFFDGATKPVKNTKGRKPRRYIMPSNSQLRRILDTRFSSSDPLPLDDLSSAKKTRQASHRELIRRRPGQYPRHWLAKRLGVSVRTTQRYDLELHMHVQPMFDELPVTWNTLDMIPDEPVPGVFLRDDRQRRYPAKREIAVYLLPRVRTLNLMRQRANYYTFDEPRVALAKAWKYRQARQAQLQQQITLEQGRAISLPTPILPPAAQPRSGLPPPANPPEPLRLVESQQRSKSARYVPKLTKRRARQPLPDRYQEALAQRVYTTINSRTADPHQRISQANARRAVFTYGTQAVEDALRLTLRRKALTNPPGFFLTVLRSTRKITS